MKVTLVHTSPKREVVQGTIYPRLNCVEGAGVAYLGAYLERDGHEVKIISEMDELGRDTFQEIVDSDPEMVGYYTMTSTFPRIVDYSRRLKELSRKTGRRVVNVVGGDHVSSDPLNSLSEGIDFGVKGEGEQTLAELVQSIESGKSDFSGINGLIYKQDGSIQVNQPRERIRDLDSLPFPKRDHDMLRHTTIGMLMYPKLSDQNAAASVLTSRGCPYSCEFCSSQNVWGNSVVYRSVDNVVKEIKGLEQTFGTNSFFFPDLTFNANPQRVVDVSRAVKKAGVQAAGYVVMRLMAPNGKELVNFDMLREMREAGFRKIGWGVESLASSIQDTRLKKAELGYTRQVFKWCEDLGILTKAFMMVGYPEETRGTIEETLENLKKIGASELRVSKLTPFPGTPLYREMEAKGRLLTSDLSLYDTNTPIIRTDGLLPDEVKQAVSYLVQGYFNSPEYHAMVARQTVRHPELKRSYEEFFKFLKGKEILR